MTRPIRQTGRLPASLDALRSGGPPEAFMSAARGAMAGALTRFAATHLAIPGMRLDQQLCARSEEGQRENPRRGSPHGANESHKTRELDQIVVRKDQISSLPVVEDTTAQQQLHKGSVMPLRKEGVFDEVRGQKSGWLQQARGPEWC